MHGRPREVTYGEPNRGHPVWSLGEEDSRVLIKHALDAGINFFDTANMYSQGSSEEILGVKQRFSRAIVQARPLQETI